LTRDEYDNGMISDALTDPREPELRWNVVLVEAPKYIWILMSEEIASMYQEERGDGESGQKARSMTKMNKAVSLRDFVYRSIAWRGIRKMADANRRQPISSYN